ncbi:hypothetical protein V8F33_007548 [Rhypophila sp. PSN 637]
MATDHGSAGRISQAAFMGMSSAFLGVCLIASGVRFYIRFRVQRELGWDDGFLIFGLACIVSAFGLLFNVMDTMYETEELVFNESGSFVIDDVAALITRTVRYHRISAAALTLMWFSLCSVKFSFLVFFKRLIRQMPHLEIYWSFTLAFNIIVTCFGAAVFLIACPYFTEDTVTEALKCVQGDGLKSSLAYSSAQMALDIAGDLFILVIPVILIWKIRIRWTQKIALSLTLCLTIVIIAITVARIIGLQWKGKLDSVWETFFTTIAAETGLTLVAITAFRTLYVAKAKNRRAQRTINTFNWYKIRSAILHPWSSDRTARRGGSENIPMGQFITNEIPHGTMTGAKSFIQWNGKFSGLDSAETRSDV